MTFANLKKLFEKSIKPLAVAAVFSLAAIAMPQQAVAQNLPRGVQCGDREHMVKTLGQRFKENRFAMGLASNVSLLEFFVSKSGTWTILSTRADGKTCVIAAGKSWVNMPVPLVGEAVVLQR